MLLLLLCMCPRFGRRILARSIVFECLPPSFEGGTYANWHTFLGALCAAFVDQRHRKIKQLSEKQLFATKDCDCLTALHCAAFRGHVAFCEKHLGPCKLEILPVFFSHMEIHVGPFNGTEDCPTWQLCRSLQDRRP